MTVQPTGQPSPGPDERHDDAAAAVAAAGAVLLGALVAAQRTLTAALDRIRATFPDESPAVRRRRASGFAALAVVVLDQVDADVERLAPAAAHDLAAAAAAAAMVDVGQRVPAGQRVVDAAARDLRVDLQAAVAYMLVTARQVAREVRRLADAPGPVETLTQQLERTLAERGLAAIVYKNGARHQLDTYARMVVRTKLAELWQRASLDVYSRAGVTHVEVTDGSGCGWTRHDDPDKANGSIRTLAEAAAYPISHPNCTMPGTRSRFAGGLRQLVRAWYEGPSYTLRWSTSVGAHWTTIGPNHPVLTRRGWIPARLVHEGDELLHHGGIPPAQALGPVTEPDLEQVPPRIEDLFETLATAHGYVSVPLAADDLHGDGVFCQGEIQVVDADGDLLPIPDSCLVEHPGQGDLVRANVQSLALAGSGSAELLVGGLASSPDSSVSGLSALASLLWRQAGHVQAKRVPLASRQAEGAQPGAQSGSAADGHAVSDGDRVTGQALLDVEPDELVCGHAGGQRLLPVVVESVEVGWHRGWVYDASTSGGWFTANDAIVRNCVRASFPRLDVRTAEQARAARPLGRGSARDGDAAGMLLAVRTASGTLDTRALEVLSPAAARHAQVLASARARQSAASQVTPTRRASRVTPRRQVSGPP